MIRRTIAPDGIWSDGTHIWVVDTEDFRLYAYRLDDGSRDTAAEFTAETDLVRLSLPRGIWSDGTTIWVVVYQGRLLAYNFATGTRDASLDIRDLGINDPSGIWSDGTYFWLSGTDVDGKLLAYGKAGLSRIALKDIALHEDNDDAYGIGSDGATTVWVGDTVDNILYGYAYLGQDDAPDFGIGATINNQFLVSKIVPENAAPGTEVGSPVTATDQNTGDTITYSLSGAGADLFDIDNDGQITVASGATLDYETTPSYTLTATATDSLGLAGTATVVINLENVDEPGTVILTPPRPVVGSGLTATLTDLDGPPSSVRWVWAKSSNEGATWTDITEESSTDARPRTNGKGIVPRTIGKGIVPRTTGRDNGPQAVETDTLLRAADTGTLLRATAYYDDPQGPDKSAREVASAQVSNPPPEFTSDSLTFTVNENAAAGVNVGSPVGATDTGDDTITYSLSGTGVDRFDIDDDGQITVASGATLDYETTTSYRLTVTATDTLGAFSTATVNINVTNVDEAGTVTLSSSQPVVGTGLTATLTDLDGATSSVSWVWARSSNNGRTWRNISGATSAGYTPVSADGGALLRATASYTDPQGSGKSASAVSSVPVSNTAPEFATGTFTRSVAESAAAGDNVGSPVTATDAGDDTITYRLSGTGASRFDIDGDGQITVASGATLDYETTTSYTLTVTATDTSNASHTATVNITVTNVDEAGTVTLSSSQPAVGTGLTATLTDPDGATSSVSWVWARSTNNGATWRNISGARSTGYTPVSADVGALLRATASYTDPHDSGKSANAVSGVPVSNPAPEFASASVTFTVAESAAAGDNVGSPVTATDAGDDTITYRLSGFGASLFDIDGDGQITVASGATLDYETTTSYRLGVTATDTSNATDTATVNINVTNVDEAGTVTLSSSRPAVGDELTATLTDPDGATSSVSWVWAKSSDNGATWTNISGARSAGYTPVTADAGALLRATASYTDPEGSGKSADAVSAVVSNPAPEYSADTFTFTLLESAVAGTKVGSQVIAYDPGDTLSYSLSGTGSALFAVDGDGQITVASGATLDFETTAWYSLVVTATDTSDATDTATVNIRVLNVDEAGTVAFSSSQPAVGTRLTATLTDLDGATSSVSWVWARSTNNGRTWRTIGGATSATYTPASAEAGALLRATASYTDPQGSNKSANAVSAVPVSNPAPEFASSTFTRSVAESAAAGDNVGSPVTATDAGDDTISYRLSGTGAFLFAIDSDGQINVVSGDTLDYEAVASFALTVTATDTSNATGTATVNINVTNVDEAGTVTLSSSQPAVGTGLTATLTDLDGATSSVSWVWARSPDNGRTWRNISGAASAGYTPVTADAGALLRATASYTDPEGSGKSADAVSSVPVSNPAPEFASGTYTVTVAENAVAGSEVGSPVTATDAGDDTLSYRLSGTGAALFDIDSDGQITVASGATLDYETTRSYRLTVTATDTSDATDTATVNISVTNVDEAGTVTLSSPQPQVGSVLTATLTDLDGVTRSVSWVWAKSSNNGTTWTNISGARSARYTPATGDLGDLLRATASYTDPQGSGKSANAVAANAVQAAPVTNSAPVFASDSVTLTVFESAVAGDNVGSPVTAADPGDTVSYKLSGSGSTLFAIDGDGQITVASGATLDFETTRSYRLTVTATDTSNASDTATVDINVTNVDEAGTVTLSSSQPAVGTGLTATLTDLDGTTSSVSWVWAKSSNNGRTWSNISGATSASYTPVSADAGALLRATATYTDPEGSGKSASAVSSVPVSNPAPEFATSTFTMTVAESAAAGTDVGSPVTATDAGDDTLGYSLSGTGSTLFAIDSDGQITLASGATLDFETTRSYRLMVTATDTSNASDTATVNINVTNVDEAGTVALSSPQPQVGSVLTATLTDLDGATRSVRWVWARSSDNGANWRNISGARSATYTPVTADAGALLRATATYTDPEGSGKSASAVSSVPVSNPAPEFATSTFTMTVAENAAAGSDVGSPVTATDAGDDTLGYSLSGTGVDLFAIDGDGQITVASGATLDFETTASYRLTVTATDTSNEFDTATVNINLTNVDEAGTVAFSSSQPTVGTRLTAMLTDLDGATSSESWVWAKSSNNGRTWSNISGVTSETYTPVTADVGALLRSTASYTDPQGSNKSANAVQAAKVSNPAPVFPLDNLVFTVNEDAAPGDNVGSPVTATDAGDDTVSYRLSGAGGDQFAIDSDGQITVASGATLDFESTASYTLTVTATDTSNASDTATVTINVTNVDEAGTVTFSSSQPVVGTVLTARFNDLDGEPVSLSWEWAKSSDNGRTWTDISGATSASYTPVTADVGALLRATASYEDLQGSGKSAFGVTASAVSNPAPVFDPDSVRLTVDENAVAGTEVGSPVTATDAGDDTLSYRLSGTGASLFAVDSNGQITVASGATFDFETTASHTLTLAATDTSASTDTATVTIDVANADEVGTVAFSSYQPVVGTAFIVTLSDLDGATSSVRWEWAKSVDSGVSWDTISGARSDSYTPVPADAGALLRATATYNDPEGSGKSANGVSEEEVSNTRPIFILTSLMFIVDENAAAGTDVGSPVTATDAGDTLSYGLSGTGADLFTIDSSGQISVAPDAVLDFETTASYALTVTATDASNETNTITVTINVVNVDEAGTVTLDSAEMVAGVALVASLSDIDAVTPQNPSGELDIGVTWVWAKSSNNGAAWTDIAGATSATYTPVAEDVDASMRVTALYTDPQGSGKSAFALLNVKKTTVIGRPITGRPTTGRPTTGGPSGPSPTGGEPKPPPDGFTDLADAGVHEDAVRELDREGVLVGSGCGDGRLCPLEALPRREMAVWLVQIVDGKEPPPTTTSRFADVDPDAWYAPHVERLAELGITIGCADGLVYCPDEPVKRSQMANFLTRAFQLKVGVPPAGFEDVSVRSNDAPNIDAVFAAGVTVGCSTDPLLFCPNAPVQRSQMASFLVRARIARNQQIAIPATEIPDPPEGEGVLPSETEMPDPSEGEGVLSSETEMPDPSEGEGVLSSETETPDPSEGEGTPGRDTTTPTDPQGPDKSANEVEAVTVSNTAPGFAWESRMFIVAENAVAGTEVGSPVTATDADDDTLSYRLSGTGAGLFAIDSTGQISVAAGAVLDFETTTSYTLAVTATDTSKATNTITVIISVVNVDEAGTVTLTVTLDSSEIVAGVALAASLSDLDAVTWQNPSGELGTGVTWVWARSSNNGAAWTDIAGATSATYMPVADDVGALLRVTALYTDPQGSGKSASALLNISTAPSPRPSESPLPSASGNGEGVVDLQPSLGRFSDLADAGAHEAAVRELDRDGVLVGSGCGFCPNESVKRSQMASFLVRARAYGNPQIGAQEPS